MIPLTDLSPQKVTDYLFINNQSLKSDTYTIYYLYEGSVALSTKSAQISARPGDCFFVPPYTNVHVRALADARALCLSFSPALFISTLFKIPGVHFPCFIPPKPVCDKISRQLRAMENQTNTFILYSGLLSIAGHVSAITHPWVPGLPVPKAPGRDRLKEVFAYLKENCTLNIPLSEAASDLKLTPQYLTSFIRSSFGETYHDIIIHLQSCLAVQYLSYTSMSKDKAARLCGFSNPNRMDAALKKYFGPPDFEQGDRHEFLLCRLTGEKVPSLSIDFEQKPQKPLSPP